MIFADTLTLDAPKRTRDGYLAVRAKAARTGVYQYAGSEVDPNNEHGLRDKAVVNVLRDEATVFDRAAVQSFIGKPITDDHPASSVTAANWKDLARGTIMGALRDGEYVAFDLLLTDAATIAKVEDGKRELSNGYGAELEFGTFTANDGTVCDVRQSKITGGNHIALVKQGRAGSECRIADAATCEGIPVALFDELLRQTYNEKPIGDKTPSTNAGKQSGDNKMSHTLIIDGLQVTDVSDPAKAAIEKLQGQVKGLTDAKAEVDTKVGELTASLSTKDGEIAALTKRVEDAKLDGASIDKLVADRAALIDQAKKIVPALDAAGKTDAEIRKAVVDAKLGDAAKDMDEAAIGGAFKVLAADAKPADPVRTALSGTITNTNDGASIRDAALAQRNRFAKQEA